ncbi:hypothetical protein AB0G35_35815 [Streptomyces sp. NPDC021749]|uniref:hypothetical protein n=1 Tax=Streptomyces sp. NPDC021749 TaxID=3154905 RepID=UPI0033D83CB4
MAARRARAARGAGDTALFLLLGPHRPSPARPGAPADLRCALPYVPWTTAAALAGGALPLALLATGVPVRPALLRRARHTLAAARPLS